MERTAVLVIDMQNGFCSDGGALAGDASVRARYAELVPEIQGLCQAAREGGGLVVYTRHGYRPGYPEMGHELRTLHPEVVSGGGMVWGGWDTQIIPGLAPEPDDIVVRKSRFDSFLGTDLQLVLSASDVRRLVVCGVSTNVCVESTVRSASQRGYDVAVASDATAATTTALHQAALDAMTYAFAAVAPWRELAAGA
jgi:nicotinamidase-related amidase